MRSELQQITLCNRAGHVNGTVFKLHTNIKRPVQIIVVLFLSLCGVNSNSMELTTVSIVPGSYNVKTEISMPHLRENLRYATTHTTQCLGPQDAFRLFPILSQASFQGCAFVESHSASPLELELELVCSNPTAASGQAKFELGEAFFRANLNVKMGGKNMKFTQIVSGQRTGACEHAQ